MLLVRFIKWFLMLIVRLTLKILGLALLAFIGLFFWFSIVNLEDKIIPALILLRMFSLRMTTMAFLDSRFYKDKTWTYDRIENPHHYNDIYTTWEDRFSNFLIRSFPSIRNRSDFGAVPLPYNLLEKDKLSDYIKKTFVWTILTIAFCVMWFYDIYGDRWIWLVHVWAVFSLLGLFLMSVEKKTRKILKITRKPIKLINRNLMEICESFSLGLVSRSVFITKFRSRAGTILVLSVEIGYLIWYRLTS